MSQKAIEIRAQMADELKKRTTLTVVEGFDTNGFPTLTLGDGVTEEENAVIRVRTQDFPLAKDGLGLPSTSVNPHVIQVCTEAIDDALILTQQTQLCLMAVVLKQSTFVELYESAFGTPPAIAEITSGNKVAEIDPDLYYPLLGSN